MGLKRPLAFLLLIALLVSFLLPPQVYAQTETPTDVTRLLETLSPEERVGQLFLVTFTGTDTGEESQIYDLIVNYHIGGVVLSAENDNFAAAPNTVADADQLITELQRMEAKSTETLLPELNSVIPLQPAYIPLLVGIEQDGDGYPTDQIFSGLTAMPNAMALGATWKPELVQQIGEVQGAELEALGFNLYIGPTLDVLETPNPAVRSNIGTRAFGGDPYWVGEMGRAFISGLHTGSDGRMLVVAKHFPGLGGSDRPISEEVATVRKSLEQLKQIELAPFFAVTGKALDSSAAADGLIVSHIRFQGFQGNIRATTRPVSFDQSALGEMLALPEIADWHNNGGLIVSDDLGSRAVRTFYAPANQGFSASLVARDAFLAGNDMLYLGNIYSNDVDDTYTTTIDVLDFFAQRYREDPTFAQQVDEAVSRILTRKYDLFGSFTVDNVFNSTTALENIGNSQQLVFEIARRAATLISPETQELTSIFPSPPLLRDRLVFITDTAPYAQCSDCQERLTLPLTALQDAVVRLYGPTAGGQVSEARLNSYNFDDLAALLNQVDVATMESDLDRATWIVLALSDASRGQPELISRFLSGRQDLLRDKKIILFSFTAPYYLDATDISKLTAYYCLYSKQPAFIDVAARLLYMELPPMGFSPVSIPATGYDLIEVTRPKPDQVIALSLEAPPAAQPSPPPPPSAPVIALTNVPEPTQIPLSRIGDTIYIRTSVIIDHNGHTVPDGTVVRFSMLISGEGGGIIQQIDQVTTGGVAKASFALEKPGLIQIRATSEPATVSDVIQIDVGSAGEAVVITVIAPFPSETVEPTPVTPTPMVEDKFVTVEGYPRLNSWMLSIIFIGLSALLAFWVGSKVKSPRWGWRWGICVLLGGLLGYNYAVFGLPGSTQLTLASGFGGVLGISALGGLVGLCFAWLWSRWA